MANKREEAQRLVQEDSGLGRDYASTPRHVSVRCLRRGTSEVDGGVQQGSQAQRDGARV